MRRFNNQELSDALGDLTKYLQDNHSEKLFLSNPYDKGWEKIERLEKYKKILEVIGRDEFIKSHIGKLVGLYSQLSNQKAEDYINVFLRWFFRDSRTDQGFNSDRFLEYYEIFETFFYDSHLILRDSCRLFNFQCDADKIQLNDEICIREATKDELRVIQKENEEDPSKRGYEVFSKSNHFIELKIRVKKLICNSENDESWQSASESEKIEADINSKLDLVINSLRLFKPSAVYRNSRIQRHIEGFYGLFHTCYRSSFLNNIAIGKKCILTSKDTASYKSTWDKIQKCENDNELKIALTRFGYAIDRRNIADRILDSFIGLESLYLPDGNSELTFRLSLRASKMLGDSPDKQEDIFKFLKQMYDVRSKVAHGKKIETKDEDLNRLENLFQNSILKYIEDKSKYKKENLDRIIFKT